MILGAGINGAALARELVLAGVPVVVVDRADISAGATAYSSRLIHGGLRYLEYGEFDLVRESLAERTRLLALAPQFVKPLRLFIPTGNRFGGLFESATRFLLGRTLSRRAPSSGRGLWLVRMGLWLYDRYARDPMLPRHAVQSVATEGSPRVDPRRYRWLCSYHDAQIRFPERFVVALLQDARSVAAANGSQFELYPYHHVDWNDGEARIQRLGSVECARRFRPSAIVNATGAWVDRSLRELRINCKPLMAGTKGSHLISWQPRLRAALAAGGLYAEASDGRPVFVLPFGEGALVGTTDERYEGDPADAVASDAEVDYLVATVNQLLPSVQLTRADIALHYCGVRPLPAVGPGAPAGVTRRHWLEEHPHLQVPAYSVIGGKLTTCRSLAEEAVATLATKLRFEATAGSRDRPLPGAERYPGDDAAMQTAWRRLADATGLNLEQVVAVWHLVGTRVEEVLTRQVADWKDNLPGTDLPIGFVRWVLEHEWVTRLSDLVERRLMLLYDQRLSLDCLARLADLMVEAGQLAPDAKAAEVDAAKQRLKAHFGKEIIDG